jgi:hypothetical protein
MASVKATCPHCGRQAQLIASDRQGAGAGALTRLDVTKFQNFVFTVALAFTYLWNCLWLFAHAGTPSAITGLPAFSGVALGLLGISHAGYLTGKAIPQSGTPKTDSDTMLANAEFTG